MARYKHPGYVCCVALLSLRVLIAAAEVNPDSGAYLFHAAGCAFCHTAEGGQPLAGGRTLHTEFGTFYSPNITPDLETGIGGWSDADFLRALKAGVAPDGRHYFPVFPYTSYTRLSRRDALAIKQYLFAQPAVAQANKPHDVAWYLSWNPVIRGWKFLNFDPAEPETEAEYGSGNKARGEYLAQALAHCGECHTPRNYVGGFEDGMAYAGTKAGPEGKSVPNITPHKRTGVGSWSKSELVEYLRSGETPEADFAGGLMAEVIDNVLNGLNNDDLEALAGYILSLPPIEHVVAEPESEPAAGEFD